MNLTVNMIGRVEKAEIEVNGLTIVAGGNASGKSTISKALYVALSATHRMEEKARLQKKRSIAFGLRNWTVHSYIMSEAILAIKPDAENALVKLFQVKDLSKEQFFELLNEINKEYQLSGFNEKAPDALYEKYLDFSNKTSEYYKTYAMQSVLRSAFGEQSNTIGYAFGGNIELMEENAGIRLHVENNKVEYLEEKGNYSLEVCPIYIKTPNILPTIERAFYPFIGESIPTYDIESMLMKELSLDSMTAEEYHIVEEQKEIFSELFAKVIDGDLRKESSKLMYYDNWCNTNLELLNTASGIKIFAIIKRLIANGSFLGENVLIIDEPETNLHPEWQLKLAELLVLIYERLSIRIYVNTHSPYFLRAMEYYAVQYNVLNQCNFYAMEQNQNSGMFVSHDVTENLGVIYDKLAAPFNEIM